MLLDVYAACVKKYYLILYIYIYIERETVYNMLVIVVLALPTLNRGIINRCQNLEVLYVLWAVSLCCILDLLEYVVAL